MMRFLLLVVAVIIASICAVNAVEYGVDCSFPQHRREFACDEQLLDGRPSFYEQFLEGCRRAFPPGVGCDKEEANRLAENLLRPPCMVNYTKTGYAKGKAPAEIMNLLTRHWQANRHDAVPEGYEDYDVTVNHWEANISFVNVNIETGLGIAEQINSHAKASLEKWTGMELRPVSVYGIRVYQTGSILTPHLDRYPLVTSVIINVDQDLDEPWPLEVIDHDGRAVNVTMEPGDWVFYESHSVIHGRPFTLKGKFMANCFVHMEPTGRQIDAEGNYYWPDDKDQQSDLPPYIMSSCPEEDRQEYLHDTKYQDRFSDEL